MALEVSGNIPNPTFSTQSADDIEYPYLWWFHRREEIKRFNKESDAVLGAYVNIIEDYIEGQLTDEWRAVENLLKKKKITKAYLRYLFFPHQMLISKDEGSKPQQLKGVFAVDWMQNSNPSRPFFFPKIKVAYWEFQGHFRRVRELVIIEDIPQTEIDEPFFIQDLSVFPTEYASSETVQALRARDDDLQPSRGQADARFMVDHETYCKMHPGEGDDDGSESGDLEPDIMNQDFPELEDEFFMCLPTTMIGFNMQKKEWIDEETKELVQAVVTTKLRADQNTDLIVGKGNGLFILLHGVAEIAKKPLYRVTCGDIGTKAEDVEKAGRTRISWDTVLT
ncbi:AAA family ATPase [Colletotrichum sp. SAR 10_98]|nr:AAA family ATPase [Colletotrichum sp. SAR 10_98]